VAALDPSWPEYFCPLTTAAGSRKLVRSPAIAAAAIVWLVNKAIISNCA
jgi:hypothetical protein